MYEWAAKIGISPTIDRAQNLKTPKSLKKSPRTSLEPPGPEPLKSSKTKVRNVKKIVEINSFLDFSDFGEP